MKDIVFKETQEVQINDILNSSIVGVVSKSKCEMKFLLILVNDKVAMISKRFLSVNSTQFTSEFINTTSKRIFLLELREAKVLASAHIFKTQVEALEWLHLNL